MIGVLFQTKHSLDTVIMSKDFFGNFQYIWFPSYFVKVPVFILGVCSPDILWDERRRKRGYQRRRNYNQRHQQRPQHTQQVFLCFFKTDFPLFFTSDFSHCCISYFVFATQQVTTIDSCDAFERNFFSTFETFHKI